MAFDVQPQPRSSRSREADESQRRPFQSLQRMSVPSRESYRSSRGPTCGCKEVSEKRNSRLCPRAFDRNMVKTGRAKLERPTLITALYAAVRCLHFGKSATRSPTCRGPADVCACRWAENLRAEVLGKPCQPFLPLRVVHQNLPIVPGTKRQRCVNCLKSAAKVSRCILDRYGPREGASVNAGSGGSRRWRRCSCR